MISYADHMANGRDLAAKLAQGHAWFSQRAVLLDPVSHLNDTFIGAAANACMRIPIGGSVLDLGCGDGFLDYYVYSRRAGRIVGVDTSEEAIEEARRYHAKDGIEYMVGDILDVKTDPSSFDVVILRGVLPGIGIENAPAIAAIAKRALRPGGWFVGDTCHDGSYLARMLRGFWVSHTVEAATGMPSGRNNYFWQAQKEPE